MTRLTFDGFVAVTSGRAPGAIDLDVEGARIALVGEWDFVFDLASGRQRSEAGRLLIDGTPIRDATIAGRLGVADASVPILRGYSIAQWIETHCRLQGHSPERAKEYARVILERLGLSYLGRYQLENLPAQTLYAARAALAAATDPTSVLLGAPPWTEDTRSFDQALLDAISRHHGSLIVCDPAWQPELFLSCDVAVVLGSDGARVQAPRQLWSADGSHYAVLVQGDPAPLAARLAASGASVAQAGTRGELWVSLPSGTDTALLVQSAIDTDTALHHVRPLLEARRHELVGA